MGRFSDGLSEILSELYSGLVEVAGEYSGHVIYEYQNRLADTPLMEPLVTVGIHSVKNELSAVTVQQDDDAFCGNKVSVQVAITFYSPQESGYVGSVEVMMDAMEAIFSSQSLHCLSVECEPINYSRSKRAIYMKCLATFEYFI